MDKKQFILLLAQRTGLSIQEARRALNACLELIVSANSHQQKVAFSDFGTFQVQHLPDPQERWMPVFLPGEAFTQALS